MVGETKGSASVAEKSSEVSGGCNRRTGLVKKTDERPMWQRRQRRGSSVLDDAMRRGGKGSGCGEVSLFASSFDVRSLQ